MREEGVIHGWGMEVNRPEPILRYLGGADSDVHLLASQYSLIDHADAVERVLPSEREAGVSLVVGSALNAGFLGGESRYNYGAATASPRPRSGTSSPACARRQGTTALI